jgi:hypothetical protein
MINKNLKNISPTTLKIRIVQKEGYKNNIHDDNLKFQTGTSNSNKQHNNVKVKDIRESK